MEIELGSEYNLEISNKFYNSLDEILRYLLDISPKTHDSFKKDITDCIDKIYIYPLAFPILRNSNTKRQYRHIIYKKSYKIIYFVDENNILLCDILHVKRNPKILKYLDAI
jgi:plasmid stabilization system protein ParE